MEVLALATIMARPMRIRDGGDVVDVTRSPMVSVVEETPCQGADMYCDTKDRPPVPTNLVEVIDNASAASSMTISPADKRATVLELIDNPVEVRFRVMPSPGKSKILFFEKPYWYNHDDPLDLEIESNTDIVQSRRSFKFRVISLY